MKQVVFMVVCVLAFAGSWSSPSCCAVVYMNDFEGAVGPEWSHNHTELTPFGERSFLGQFSNEQVTLSLNNLPSHTELSLAFDLFIIRTWDGNLAEDPNYPGNLIGPDIWDLTVVGGPTLLHTTFNNHDFYDWTQAYPGDYPEASFAARTGAIENNTLGFTHSGYGVIDSVYRLSFTFAHGSDSVVLRFSDSTVDWVQPLGVGNESWGLDNVQLSVTPIPEPSGLLALAGGLGGIAGMLVRRSRR